MRTNKLLFFLYPLVIFSLFLYSFTQVDLSLTLSKSSIYQTAEKGFQYIGFFQRPTSTLIFSIMIILLFVFYLYFLRLSKRNLFPLKSLKIIIFLTFVLLVFSYNAFSYDLFNYIFDAKIVTFYHLNPYIHKALDFPNDPMLYFMRWTHRTYPYGPSWLALTVPLSFIGSNIFLLTFMLFKFMLGFFYLGSSYLIYKLSEVFNSKTKIFNTTFWALNPLVIIESLVSSHNDIPLIFFGLLSFYLFIKNKKTYSVISYVFSVGVKFSTGVLLPIYMYLFYAQKKNKKINWEKIFLWSFYLSILVIALATVRTTFQPWYLIFPLSLASFVSNKSSILVASISASVFGCAVYIPYVLLTDYAPNYPSVIENIELVGFIITIILFTAFFYKDRFIKH